MKTSNLFHTKTAGFNIPQTLKEQGIYPYFRPITSDQDTIVKIHNQEVLMFGSNSYMGLTNHPHVKEAGLNYSKILKFRHNDMRSLEKRLSGLPDDTIKLIVVDGVFSMEGDIADLPAITALGVYK